MFMNHNCANIRKQSNFFEFSVGSDSAKATCKWAVDFSIVVVHMLFPLHCQSVYSVQITVLKLKKTHNIDHFASDNCYCLFLVRLAVVFYSQYGCLWRKIHRRVVRPKHSGSSTEVCLHSVEVVANVLSFFLLLLVSKICITQLNVSASILYMMVSPMYNRRIIVVGYSDSSVTFCCLTRLSCLFHCYCKVYIDVDSYCCDV